MFIGANHDQIRLRSEGHAYRRKTRPNSPSVRRAMFIERGDEMFLPSAVSLSEFVGVGDTNIALLTEGGENLERGL